MGLFAYTLDYLFNQISCLKDNKGVEEFFLGGIPDFHLLKQDRFAPTPQYRLHIFGDLLKSPLQKQHSVSRQGEGSPLSNF